MDAFDDKSPAQVDLHSEREVIQHIRDLVNFSEFLQKGFDNELSDFIKKLSEAGWSKGYISSFLTRGCYGTKYDQVPTDFPDHLPTMIPQRGDRREYEKNKTRWRK